MVTELRPAPDQWRERLAEELEAAARRVRNLDGRPTSLGIILVSLEHGERCVYTVHEGHEQLSLMGACFTLAARIDASLEHRSAPSTGGDDEN